MLQQVILQLSLLWLNMPEKTTSSRSTTTLIRPKSLIFHEHNETVIPTLPKNSTMCATQPPIKSILTYCIEYIRCGAMEELHLVERAAVIGCCHLFTFPETKWGKNSNEACVTKIYFLRSFVIIIPKKGLKGGVLPNLLLV